MLLVDRFRRNALALGDKTAVVQDDLRVSFSELEQLSASVANTLIARGLVSGERVALLLANSADYIGIFYGVWRAGCVTVALNTQAKARDIVNWMSHCDARCLFADAGHPELDQIEQLLDHGVLLVRVQPADVDTDEARNGIWASIREQRDACPSMEIQPSDIASIIYTSGTTGNPKGVTLSHGNLASNVDSILAYLRLDQNDSIVNVLPFYYSYGNSILHTHLAAGARLVLENSLVYPHRVVERIGKEAATGFSGVPSTYTLLLGRVKLENYDLSSLRYITQAGGPMPPSVTDRLIAAIPHAEIFIMYGQTEASARLTYLPSGLLRTKRNSIGIAIPGVTIEIRDKDGSVTPPWVTGEICARGDNIMLGYWRDVDKTREVIVDGWLHTGDLAHYDDEGFIYIDGRSSDMIKSGGNRISPKEVEEVIQEMEGVQEVAVVGVSDELLGETIKAFVVPMRNSHLDIKSIQLHCRNNLAVYKIPKTVEFVESLPRTASGKIKRFLLQNQGA